MSFSRLDVLYRKILLTKFFTKGWGSAHSLQKLLNFRKIFATRDKCYKLVPKDYDIKILSDEIHGGYRLIEGEFLSPFALHMGKIMPAEICTAYFQMLLPLHWPSEYRPICIHLAGTGDHYFWRRRNVMAKPLLKEGIGSIILENPFYGLRKPKTQIRSSLHHVSDIFVMGGCLILECIALLNWCQNLGFGPLGITGISMGGHMASLAASNWPKPLVLVPCLSWSTASSVFTEGVMSESIDWDNLQREFFSDYEYHGRLSKACKIVDSPFACSLSRISDYEFDDSMLNDKIGYVSPYDIMNLLDSTYCRAVNYKHSSQSAEMKRRSALELFKYASVSYPNSKIQEKKKRDREALWFMRGVMDEFTHLRNFSVPYDTSLITSICAKSDAYVPRTGVSNLEDIWPGAHVQYVDTGHIGAYIWYRKLFRKSIVDTFERAKKVVPPPEA